ncbi:MAG TPA: UvrD-helicase domain-containing protein [Candidatus Anaerobiospirillum pullistercoris]|uniref:DNA 3'-5' helicase n=1 Tax=Candidatus Anaerobiospirillum pullistercoris TaxID=2838452 RepID=A0A9D2B2G7_9GAMM|nr:UvrD-helicase domain-containing protein [Candidatus Anaerobiospirillum pullistercoris]
MAKMQLNAAQQEAVTYTQGPCLVLAGAGSGKTRVIITKIAYLLRNNLAQPAQILAVTFTNKAAAEMRERIALEVGPEISSQLTICTFHSLGRQILKEQAQLLRLGSHFSIFDETDTLKILKGIIASDYSTLKSTQSADYLSTVASHISRWKGELKNPSSILKDPKSDHITAELYQKYSDYLRACNAVDFDDLIYLPTRLLLLNEKVRSYYQQRYRYIMVDEYQDTNHTQYYLLMCLVASNQRFMVVGDDDQSIYSWRGARPENIKQLTVDFPELKVIKLEQNYRSTSRILHCANSIIAHNQHLFSKTLYSGIEGGEPIRVVTCNDNEQSCEYIAAEILGHRFDHRSKWGDYAILYRSNSQSRDMEKALMSAHIPCKITGDTSFFARMEVKDIMAWCRVLTNPKDDAALLRIINVPHRGIGAQTIKIMTELGRKFNRCLYDCAISQEMHSALNKQQVDALCSFLGLLFDLRHKLAQHHDLEVCRTLIDKIGYRGYLRAENASTNAFEWKLKNVQILMGWIEELLTGQKNNSFGKSSTAGAAGAASDLNQPLEMRFGEAVERLGLREMMDKKADEDEEQDAVQMMTLHAAKGLEFPVVFLLGMEEGILPHRTSIEEHNIEEERRLAYVGVTRAQKELTLVVARQRKQGNSIVQQEPSRFIGEMPKEELTFIDLAKPQKQSKESSQHGLERVIEDLAQFAGQSHA